MQTKEGIKINWRQNFRFKWLWPWHWLQSIFTYKLDAVILRSSIGRVVSSALYFDNQSDEPNWTNKWSKRMECKREKICSIKIDFFIMSQFMDEMEWENLYNMHLAQMVLFPWT